MTILKLTVFFFVIFQKKHYRNHKPIFNCNPVSQKKKKETFIYIYGFQKKKIFF